MKEWVVVAREQDVDGDGPYHVSAEDTDAVLVRVGGELRAFEGRCPHQGALLGEGELVDGQLVCRNHRWCFDAETGRRDGGPECLQSFPLRVVDGNVQLDFRSVFGRDQSEAGQAWDDLPGPKGMPILGNIHQLNLESMHAEFEEWVRQYGDVCRMKFGPTRGYLIADPDLIAEALRRRPHTFSRSPTTQPVFDEIGIGGVFSEEGESWRSMRKLMVQAVSRRRLSGLFPMLYEMTERLLNRWERLAEAGETIDPLSEVRLFTIDVMTRLAFAEETDAIGGGENWLLERMAPVFPTIWKRWSFS